MDSSVTIPLRPFRERSEKCRIRCMQYSTIVLSFFCYSCLHMARQSWSVSKNQIEEEDGIDQYYLGMFDTLFLCFYAVGLIFNGYMGDRYNLRWVISAGLLGAGLCTTALAVGGICNITHPAYYAIFFALNGLIQSTGWPCNVSVVGNWVPRRIEGIVMGIWSVCNNVGNIFGEELSNLMHSFGGYRWPYVILVSAMVCLAFSVIAFFCLIEHPSLKGVDVGTLRVDTDLKDLYVNPQNMQEIELGGVSLNGQMENGNGNINTDRNTDPESPSNTNIVQYGELPSLGIIGAFKLKGVGLLAGTYACMKFANYSLFFWFPLYSSRHLHAGESLKANLSSLYDIGSVFGCITIGLSSDYLRKRSPVIGASLILATIVGYSCVVINANNYTALYGLLPVLGIFLAGSCNIISSVCCSELGKDEILENNSKAMSTVTGIVDGCGSAGAALGQLLMAYLTTYGWHYMFVAIGTATLLSVFLLLKIIITDIKVVLRARRRRSKSL